MEKKALVTSLGLRSTSENYGAILQMTSFCDYISKTYNIKPEILDYFGINLNKYGKKNIMTKMLFGNTLKEKFRKILFSKLIEKRYESNIDFLKKRIATTKTFSYDELLKENFSFDYYIAESDVIWDPSFRNSGFDPVFFLSVPGFKNGKKIVYSAGLGNANFNNNQIAEFKELIKNIDYWSVREKYSKEFLEKNNIDNVVSVLDPTLVVDDSYFKSLISNRKMSKKYVLVYTPAFNNKKLLFDAYSYAQKNHCKVIIIKRVPSVKNFFDTKINVNIEDFLNYLYYCEAFFCDSYHGVCLSVQLEKDFFVYEREDGKKISDLCQILDLGDRIIKNSLPESKIDYSKVKIKLDIEKQNSKKVLDSYFK